jgi:hypothetical protein
VWLLWLMFLPILWTWFTTAQMASLEKIEEKLASIARLLERAINRPDDTR